MTPDERRKIEAALTLDNRLKEIDRRIEAVKVATVAELRVYDAEAAKKFPSKREWAPVVEYPMTEELRAMLVRAGEKNRAIVLGEIADLK